MAAKSNGAGHICLYCTCNDANYYLDCLCCFCPDCYTNKLHDKMKVMLTQKQKNPQSTIQCLFCKQQINMTVVDGSVEKYRQNLTQLNANPSAMLKSTVRNLDFKEKQMLAKNKYLSNKSSFMETLLREIVRSNQVDLRTLPKEMVEQDKFNLIESLKQSIIQRKKCPSPRHRDETLKSKSEISIAHQGLQSVHTNHPQRQGRLKSKSLLDTGHALPSGNFYGFEFRNIKRQPAAAAGGKNSAKALEEKLAAIGQNKMFQFINR